MLKYVLTFQQNIYTTSGTQSALLFHQIIQAVMTNLVSYNRVFMNLIIHISSSGTRREIAQVNATEPHYSVVNIASNYGMTKKNVTIYRRYATLS